MPKRILSCILILALALTEVPMNAFAQTNHIQYGDANADGKVDLNDILIMQRYIAKEDPSGFDFTNADVNVDNKIDENDLLMLKKYVAEWNIKLGTDILTVSFYDGERLIDTFAVPKGSPLGEVPSVAKSSKDNAILEGYYLDQNFTVPFYAEEPVLSSMNVYAKYAELGSTEELNLTSFAQMDQSPDLSFEIVKTSGEVNPANAAELIVKDGSDPVSIRIADDNGDGVYTVNAPEGFHEGCSYELTLADGWCFKDKEETIRTASFSILMEEVENLQMNDDIIYIQDTDALTYTVDGIVYDVLTSDTVEENGGSFAYDSAAGLNPGDILCIYVGIKPTERNPKNGSELLDPAVYVKVTGVNDNIVTFAPLDSEDQTELYNIPDNFPIQVEAIPEAETGSVNINALDRDMYATMLGEDGTYDKALENIAVGDYVTLYISEEGIESESSLYFGQITVYDSESGEITYEQVSKQDILDSMDLYSDVNLSGNDLITEEEKEYIETALLEQVQESNFAMEAAAYLSDMVTKTDGFRNNMTVQEYLLSDENGNPLSEEEIELLNLGGSFELTDDIELKVELITSGDQLHFTGGVQLAIKVDAGFEVEVEDGAKVAIDLTATFVEEVQIDPSVRGEIVTKEILFIPVPTGVSVNAAVDIRNFTAFSFAAEIYTVEAEDQEIWDKLKAIAKDPTEVLGLPGMPEKFKDGLETVGDVMDKIEEIKNKIDKATDTAEQIAGYEQDLEDLWNFVESNNFTTKEEWEQMGEQLGKTSVTQDLLDMMDLATDTEISAEYLEDMQALMDRYSEVVQKETDWIKLVDKEMFSAEVCICGLVIGITSDFIVRTDMSIAIGSNLEYEVGKRYNFWFKIGLFKPSAGSSSMDLLDEHFAFQFYVMGRLGMKAGVRAEIYCGIGSGKFASVGIAVELGPYVKLYGFFVYEYTKYRPANTQDWTSKERMAGALYLDFGLYLMVSFEANALGDLFEYSHDFVDLEIPLLTAGNSRYYYNNAYEPAEDEMVIVRDEDGNSTNGITMTLPDSTLALSYLDLDTGIQGSQSLDFDKYIYTVSNPNFAIDSNTGKISVTVPEDTRFMECDLTITYRYGKMAFSQYDMTVTVPLVWTNLSTDELSEYYTASVRVGNDEDGYQTVWHKRVLKNQQYDLPTDEEIKEMIGWNDAKYTVAAGYNGQETEGLTLIEDTVYDYVVDYKQYTVTVDGIQNEDGTTVSRTYTAKFGEAFDFSDLTETGTAKDGTYTKFAKLTTNATIQVNGANEVIDLTQKINTKLANALAGGVHATAEYVDNSVGVVFSFVGLEHEDVEQRIQKGTEPSLDAIEAIVSYNGLAIKEITPEIGKVNAYTMYQVICGEIVGPSATITFHENGGSDVADITKVEGSLIGALPTPVREGYTFDGWYTDDGTFQNRFAERKMPVGGANLYAKWIANEYTVTFHVNGGNELDEAVKTRNVTFDSTYGTLPQATKSGYGFDGWYTAAEGGTKVTPDTKVTIAENHTLYAHWKELIEIPKNVFDFGEAEGGTYEKGTAHEVFYTFDAGSENIEESEFTFKYMRQGNTEYETGLPVNAGTYNVTISRPADNDYAKFEKTYEAVITIAKAERTLGAVAIEAKDYGYTYVDLQLVGDGGIDDLSSEATFTYEATKTDGTLIYPGTKQSSADRDSIVKDLEPGSSYVVTVKVTDDPNYLDAESALKGASVVSTREIPTELWGDVADTDWYDAEEDEFILTTAEQFAGLATLVNGQSLEGAAFNDKFSNKTIKLGADIDLTGRKWTPVGDGSSFGDYISFKGILDGQGYEIKGAYVCENRDGVGLIGCVLNGGKICNLTLSDSYIQGSESVGSIVGKLFNGKVDSCVSHARVKGTSTNADYSCTGGIVGYNYGGIVVNSVYYGAVSGAGNHTGGIVGYNVDGGKVMNSANFGSVTGVSAVGGVVGQSEGKSCYILNCYNAGTVKGTDKYVGAVVGRNYKDQGAVHQVYYLKGSATCNGADRNASGNKNGSDDDGNTENLSAASFTSPAGKLSRNADCGDTNLITALNNWVEWWNDDQCSAKWEAGEDGYPLPTGPVNTKKGTMQK